MMIRSSNELGACPTLHDVIFSWSREDLQLVPEVIGMRSSSMVFAILVEVSHHSVRLEPRMRLINAPETMRTEQASARAEATGAREEIVPEQCCMLDTRKRELGSCMLQTDSK